MAQSEGTKYEHMQAGDASRKYWSGDYLVDMLSMVGLGLVIIGAVFLANRGQGWAFIPATIIAFIVFTLLSARRVRNFAGLQGILMVDCDAQKMVEVCEHSAKRTKKGVERVRFRTLHGMALALSGKPDEALELLQDMPTKQPADTLNVKSVQATAYRMKGDIESLQGMVDGVQAMHDTLPDGNPLKGAAGYLLAQIDFELALDRKDWETAEAAMEHIESQAAAPERELEARYNRARLLEAQGKIDEARAAYQEVAEHKGTLEIISRSQAWLDKLPTPPELGGGKDAS